MTDAEIRGAVRRYILESFLPGEAPDTLKDETPLISSGIVASLSLVELVGFLEERFLVTLETEDVGVTRMDSIAAIAALVRERRGAGAARGPE